MSFIFDLKKELSSRSITISEFARKSGIGRTSLNSMIHHGTMPSFQNAYKIARALNVSLDTLATGKYFTQPNTTEGAKGSHAGDGEMHFSKSTFTDMSIPIYGLSACGEGMHKVKHTQMCASKQMLLSDKAYAVIAVGDSLTPMGINPGMMCFCEPTLEPVKGDIVHIIRHNNVSFLKRFDSYIYISDHRAMAVTGWLDSKQGNAEDFACEQTIQPSKYVAEKLDISLAQIKTVAPVFYVRRKA